MKSFALQPTIPRTPREEVLARIGHDRATCPRSEFRWYVNRQSVMLSSTRKPIRMQESINLIKTHRCHRWQTRIKVQPVRPALLGSVLAALILAGCTSTPTVPSELRAPSDATDCSRDQCLDFIYLHGTQRHDVESRDGFFAYVDPLHDWVMAELYRRPEVHADLLEGDRLRINPVPVKFYWGDMSSESLAQAKDLLEWSDAREGEPGFFSGLAQKYFVMGTHDTYWISEQANKRRVNLALHEIISASVARGRRTVLFGHSAGAIVIQAYAMYHLPYVELRELAAFAEEPELRSLLQESTHKTCVQAMLESGLMEFLHTGDLDFRLKLDTSADMAQFRKFRTSFHAEKIQVLPEYTRQYCATAGSVRGIVTYGHPGLILHGTLSGKERIIFLLSLRHIFENDLFWINILHVNDPVGYALYDDDKIPEKIAQYLEVPVRRRGGFIANGAETKGASVFTAHSWYWMKPKEFAEVLARTYAKGHQRAFAGPGE